MKTEFIKNFEKQYLKGEKSISKRVIHTLKGLISRIFQKTQYIEELKTTEAMRIEYGIGLLKTGINEGKTSVRELKIYKGGLKNIIIKFKHRNDFLIIAVTGLATYGLLSFTSDIQKHIPPFFTYSMFTMTALIFAERASMLAVVARSEAIINIIDSIDEKPLNK